MQKILTAAEMREVDRLTVEKYGIPSIILMENAAHAAAGVITEKLGGTVAGKNFLILCGKGNNGGDGAALARILAVQGAFVEIVLFGKIAETKGDAKANLEICQNLASDLTVTKTRHPDIFALGFSPFYECDSRERWDELLYNELDQTWDCVVDAIFGTGLTRPFEIWLGNIVHGINILNDAQKGSKNRLLVSIDLPSGLNSNLAKTIGTSFQADLTINFTAPKPANVLPPASRFNGELITVNIGSPQELVDKSLSQLFLAEKSDAQYWLRQTKFTVDSYKKTRGHALIVAGSKNMTGAAVLCADAAMQSGVGLVKVATPEAAHPSVSSRVLPEIMVSAVAETAKGAIDETALEQVLELSEKMNAVAIGCGLSSKEKSTRNFVRKFVKQRRTPVVIDADGLNALAPFDLRGSDELPLILTPHIGEMRRLLGVDERADLSDNVKIAREFAQKHHVVLVLKGERSLIAAPEGMVVINPTGNSGLGKAGNGDTLTGIITGFLAQSFIQQETNYLPLTDHAPQLNWAFETVVAALYIAGLAGDIAAKKVGMRSMTASDVRACLGEAFRELEDE